MAFAEPVTVVGGGTLSRSALDLARGVAPVVVAADGGANALRGWGQPVHAVVGDMDSIRDLDAWRRDGARVVLDSTQDSTDLDKLLRHVAAPAYVAVGFLGDRLDHSLAAIGTAARCCVPPFVLVGESDLVFAVPAAWRADLAKGERLSILCLRPVCVERMTGLFWPPGGLPRGGLPLPAFGTRGVSNLATGGPVELQFDQPGALLVLRRENLRLALKSLTGASSRNGPQR